jgi:hypothetical protein
MPRACPTLVATCVLVMAACAGPAATDAAPTPPATPGPAATATETPDPPRAIPKAGSSGVAP